MKKVLKVAIKIILELIIVCILTIVAMFLMKNMKSGLRIIADTILVAQTTMETQVTETAEVAMEKKKAVQEEVIVIMDDPNRKNSTEEETEDIRSEEPNIVILDDSSNQCEENEIIELFTEKGTYFFE